MTENIKIRGARTHNLKNLNIDIPLNKITTLYGPSGSGKTSLAFATLYQESKRRLINSFPSDIKFFWDIPQTVDVDSLSPVLPTWGLGQINPVRGSQMVASDLMNLTEKFQQIFFTLGKNCCPQHQIPYEKKTLPFYLEEIIDKSPKDIFHLFIRRGDFINIYPRGIPSRSLGDTIRDFDRTDTWWEIVRFKRGHRDKIENLLTETPALNHITYFKVVSHASNHIVDIFYTPQRHCPECYKIETVKIKNAMMLSPYHGVGACEKCRGHGSILVYDREKLIKDSHLSLKEGAVALLNFKPLRRHKKTLHEAFKKKGLSVTKAFEQLPEKKWPLLYEGHGKWPGFNKIFQYFESKKYKKSIRIFSRKLKKEILCTHCNGTKLNLAVRFMTISLDNEKISYGDFFQKRAGEALEILDRLKEELPIINQVKKMLHTACHLGLEHIPLTKKVKELSASQYQRMLLIKFLSYKGSGTLFIFDEPTASLSQKEEKIVFKYLRQLRDQKNTLLLVEHSPFIIKSSDHVIEMGPSSGLSGGRVLYAGRPKNTLSKISLRMRKQKTFDRYISVQGAYDPSSRQDYSYTLPIGGISLVCAESSLDKSSLVTKLLSSHFSTNQQKTPSATIECHDRFDKVLSFLGRPESTTSRSTIGTFLGLIGYLRKHYTALPLCQTLNLSPGHFSHHSPLGQCPTCKGRGIIEIEMNFLENIQLACDDCKAMKLRPLYALIRDGQMTYHKAVNAPIVHAFKNVKMTPKVLKIIHYLKLLKLDYLSLDRPLATLSGGERQRLHLLCEIQSQPTKSLLFLENISFGLSPTELSSLLELIYQIRDRGNTIVILDENPLLKKFVEHTVVL